MKLRSLLSLLLIIILCLSVVACKGKTDSSEVPEDTAVATEKATEESKTPTNEVQGEGSTPLLYKVSDQNGNVLWLFGSIHVGIESFYPLPSYVEEAFESSDAVAAEIDILSFEKDLQLQTQAITALIYNDGSTISDHISEDLYNRGVEILKEYDSYSQFLDYYCPVLWSSMIDTFLIEELGGNPDLGIDRHILVKADECGKEIREVESAAFQYQLMADYSPELQKILLEQSIEMYNDKKTAKKDLDKMLSLWASGDATAFAEYLKSSDTESFTDEETLLYEEYNKAMITDRNISMTDYAEEALLSGDEVFICVGAAHIVGEGAMADLLTERGYTVECITE